MLLYNGFLFKFKWPRVVGGLFDYSDSPSLGTGFCENVGNGTIMSHVGVEEEEEEERIPYLLYGNGGNW